VDEGVVGGGFNGAVGKAGGVEEVGHSSFVRVEMLGIGWWWDVFEVLTVYFGL
jgi:hypothetical protein